MTMRIAVVKYLNRMRPRLSRVSFLGPYRMSSNESCPSKPEQPCPPPKAEPNPSPPGAICAEPPPCAAMPVCPPPICPPIVDPNNPCNYQPPPCIDPDYPDLTKLKKLQCYFQKDDDIPVFLKKGTVDAFLYQATIVLIIISLISSCVSAARLIK